MNRSKGNKSQKVKSGRTAVYVHVEWALFGELSKMHNKRAVGQTLVV